MGVSQDCLSRTIFPMGKYHKDEIKRLAIDLGYESLAKRVRVMKYVLFPIMITEAFKKKSKRP